MIIDVHTRIWLTADQLGPALAARLRSGEQEIWRQTDATPGAHAQAMICAEASILLGFRSELLDARIPDEYIASHVAADPRRRYGTAGIDPLAPDALDQIDRAVALGLCGISIAPAAQGCHPAHSRAMAVYERCIELNLPVFVAEFDPMPAPALLEFARPMLFDEVARSFPDLRLVFGRMGHPFVDETLTLLAKHRNIRADLSGIVSRPWQLYHVLQLASGMGVMNRLLFGSGFPFENPAKAIETLYSINSLVQGTPLPAVPRAHVRAIVERDALDALGLTPAGGPPYPPESAAARPGKSHQPGSEEQPLSATLSAPEASPAGNGERRGASDE